MAAIWALYAAYTWTAAPGLSTLQAARFYVPALGPISLAGAWLLARVPRRQPLAAITTLVVAGVLFGLGSRGFHNMYQFPFGRQLHVVHGPGGTVELKPGPGVRIGGPGGVAPGGPGRAVHILPSAGPDYPVRGIAKGTRQNKLGFQLRDPYRLWLGCSCAGRGVGGAEIRGAAPASG